MNFADYLLKSVEPLYGPDDKPKPRSGNPAPDHTKGNAARTKYSRERMESALPRDGSWVAGSVIARRLQTTPASSNSTLYSLQAKDLVESRRITRQSRALEWRWKP